MPPRTSTPSGRRPSGRTWSTRPKPPYPRAERVSSSREQRTVSESSRQPILREAGEIERALAAIVLGIICLITLANVVVRYFTNYSFAATEEISVVLMVVLALLGSATAVARRRHIAITILVDRLPRPLKRFADVIAETATL